MSSSLGLMRAVFARPLLLLFAAGHFLSEVAMYADPSLIRDKTVKLSLNRDELEIVKAAAAKRGMEPAAYARAVVTAALHGRPGLYAIASEG